MARKPAIIANGRDLGAVSVDELVANTKVRRRRGGIKCWAYAAEGKLKEYLDRLKEIHARKEEYDLQEALDQAQEFFGVNIKRQAFKNHISGRCGCNDQKQRAER